MHRFIILSLAFALAVATLNAADPMATHYDQRQCEGSSMPYPAPKLIVATPDSLSPVFLTHVGRHGSRFPSSAQRSITLQRALRHADSIGSITPTGRKLLKITDNVISLANGRWGALDSLGMAEQRSIASRMFSQFPELMDNGRISAISSYVPRCIMSMYEFTHQLARLNNRLEISTASGRQFSDLLRPFETNDEYVRWRRDGAWRDPYNEYVKQACPIEPLRRILGDKYPLNNIDAKELALTEYHFLASLEAMNVAVKLGDFFLIDEINALWSCANLEQYLQRSASTLSPLPADIATPLLVNIIESLEKAVAGEQNATVELRFGHAETLIPILSLLHLQGCYYLTNYFDTVANHWKNFYVVPMASNVRFVLFKTPKGRHYVRCDLNEIPTPLLPNSDDLYIPWETAKRYLTTCIPLYME